MPDRCCVTACQSNYDKCVEYVSVFKFPENEVLKKEWLKNIPRQNLKPNKRTVVCEKHFQPECIVRFDEFASNNGGDVVRVKRSRPKLKDGSVPTLFPGCPAYLSKPKEEKRVGREEKLKQQDDVVLEDFLRNDKISSYEEVKMSFSEKISNLPKDTLVLHFDSFICILFMNFEPHPIVTKSIRIKTDLTVEVFIGENKLDLNDISFFLERQILVMWSRLENLISAINLKSSIKVHTNAYESALKEWDLHVSETKETEDFKKKQFLHEQMVLSSKPKAARRYTTDMYRFAACLYIISPACYKALQNCKVLTLPCMDSLKKLLNVLCLDSSTLSTGNSNYVKAKCEKLKDEEKLVNLLIDEIHIKSKVTYKGGHITGFAENQHDYVTATAVQSFMICSVFSSFKEIVALVPVHRMVATDLLQLTKATLFMLHEAGFEVLSIISDNNSVNRNMFGLLANGELSSSPIQNPVNGANLYLLFDAVHILKCLRNNWLNQADAEKTFICPKFPVSTSPSEGTMRPRFGLLRQVYNLEIDSNIKYAFHLTAKSLYPTKLERQNVLPAVNIFHETNPAALERLCLQNPTVIHIVEDTSAFLKLINKRWDTMNVSHVNKARYTRNPDSLPLTSVNAENIVFMSSFVEWIKKWQAMQLPARNGCLSKETFYSIIQTSSTIITVAKALLKDGAQYILTAKFHTDALEFRFSEYRRMSGCNYHVSLQQILESERKLRLKSILKLHSSRYGDVPLRFFISDVCSSTSKREEMDLQPFMDVVDNLTVKISTHDSEVLTYIAGYCVHKLKLSCDACKFYYYGAFDMSVDLDEDLFVSHAEKLPHTEYLDLINRGGMKTPSANIVFSVSACYVIFQKLISSEYEKKFISYNIKQHSLIVKLTEIYLKHFAILNFDELCMQCNVSFSSHVSKVIETFCNVCLNNYSKNKNNEEVLRKVISKESKVSKDNKKQNVESNIKCETRKLKKFKNGK